MLDLIRKLSEAKATNESAKGIEALEAYCRLEDPKASIKNERDFEEWAKVNAYDAESAIDLLKKYGLDYKVIDPEESDWST